MSLNVKKTAPVQEDKAEKLSAAVKQVFQGHKAKLGAKTLTTIAWSIRS